MYLSVRGKLKGTDLHGNIGILFGPYLSHSILSNSIQVFSPSCVPGTGCFARTRLCNRHLQACGRPSSRSVPRIEPSGLLFSCWPLQRSDQLQTLSGELTDGHLLPEAGFQSSGSSLRRYRINTARFGQDPCQSKLNADVRGHPAWPER
jgi:hypothetical protein